MEKSPKGWPHPRAGQQLIPWLLRGALHHTVSFYLCEMGLEIPEMYSEATADSLRGQTLQQAVSQRGLETGWMELWSAELLTCPSSLQKGIPS